MGNQASNGHHPGHGQYGHVRHRRDSDGPPILPPHVPIPAAAAIVNNTIGRSRERRHSENQEKTGPIDARLRQLSGDNERYSRGHVLVLTFNFCYSGPIV